MQAGRMRYKLTLMRPVSIIDDFGEETPEYEDFRTVAAERVKASGFRHDEVGEHFADYRVEWNIRDAHPVKENWRVKQAGGHEYTVMAIIPNRERGMLTLVTERVNL